MASSFLPHSEIEQAIQAAARKPENVTAGRSQRILEENEAMMNDAEEEEHLPESPEVDEGKQDEDEGNAQDEDEGNKQDADDGNEQDEEQDGNGNGGQGEQCCAGGVREDRGGEDWGGKDANGQQHPVGTLQQTPTVEEEAN